MKKLMNQPEHFVKETMEGIIAAYGDKVRLLKGEYRVLLSNYETRPGKVGIVTAGGFRPSAGVSGVCGAGAAGWVHGGQCVRLTVGCQDGGYDPGL